VNTFALELWDDQAQKCTFYTVRWEDAKASETDKFFDKYDAKPEYKLSLQILLSFVLDSIGDDYGAVDALFNRFENAVVGLPNKGAVKLGEITFLFPNFPLRLYALRVNNRTDLVVLFNGGVKSAPTNQASKDLHLKWLEACRFAGRIEQALRDKQLIINKKGRIVSSDGEEDIFL
jgi:hypothetical protein